jgi:hypothetical protein
MMLSSAALKLEIAIPQYRYVELVPEKVQRKTPPSGMGEVPRGVLSEQHRSVIAAIPELVESSRCEKSVISGFSTGVARSPNCGL